MSSLKGGKRPRVAAPIIPEEVIQEELLDDEEKKDTTFEDLKLCQELCDTAKKAGWKFPTRIQAATVPVVMANRDAVGVAQTGSGKTGAFVLPLTDWLLRQAKAPHFAVLVMVPTRELAHQVAAQFLMLGEPIGLRVVTLVGGVDMVTQACELSQKPHVIVGTPGRIKDHLQNTKGFFLRKLKALVLDEADRMLDMDYEKEIDAILEHLPTERQTLLFSATLSTKVDRLQKASLRDPVMLEVHRKNTTVETLDQQFVFAPFARMSAYLHYFLSKEAGSHILVFCQSGQLVHKLTLTLRILGHRALPLMGRMTQENRNLALSKFKDGQIRVLVCTDLAQRGLDIAHTDVVINYALPLGVKDYIHRVGRTARAGSHGKAINLISQYDIVQLQTIEKAIGIEMKEWPVVDGEIEQMLQRVEDAEQEALREMREQEQSDKLTKEEGTLTSAKVARRMRGDRMDLSDNRGDTHGLARARKENEEVFGMTKKKQTRDLWKMKREAKKSNRK